MSVRHTCFLYLDQILPAATEAVPFHGPVWSRDRAGDSVAFAWVQEPCVQRTAVGRWNHVGALCERPPAERRGRKREGDGKENVAHRQRT